MENVNDNDETKQKYTIADVLEALKRMDSQYSEELLMYTKINDLMAIMNDKSSFDNYIKQIDDYRARLETCNCALHLLEDELEHPKEDNKDILTQFESLSNEEKKRVCVDLYNDRDFQNNLCLFVLDIIKQSFPESIEVMNAFGIDIETYIEEVIGSGKGYKKYVPSKEFVS